MKAISAFILSVILCLSIFQVNINASDTSAEIDSIIISEDGNELSISCSVSEGQLNLHKTFYLFRVTPDNENIKNLSPISEATPEMGKVFFSLNYDGDDHSSPIYGYILASSDGKKGYTALTEAKYIDDFTKIAHSNKNYPPFFTKKGLEVQYITDAKLLGVGHTVVYAKFNELISESEDNSVAYVYGESKYYINKDALTLLDYRIKTLTDAGIHIYINFILSFDANADSSLYYPNAEGTANTLFCPNLSSPEGVKRFAAIMHFLAERYADPNAKYGFCGSYILGYEVNNGAESNSSGIHSLDDYVKAYSVFVRTADISLRSGYSNARIFISVSNLFNISGNNSKPAVFSAKALLSLLCQNLRDVNFGIAINPYPSNLTQSTFWNDEKATDTIDTEYITMKNISVFTDMLDSDEFKCNGSPRAVVITEFGISGKYGDESEKIQAAAYAYAYYTAANNPSIEAFIWHRHVDHLSEINLSYGLYSSSEFTLDAKDKKLIHSVFSAVDTAGKDNEDIISSLLPYLPVNDYNSLVGQSKPVRDYISIKGKEINTASNILKKDIVFDFSKSIYNFYPSDNSEYIELKKENSQSFMRIATLMFSSKEYMGAGTTVTNSVDLSKADYISARIRILSSSDSADFSIILSKNDTNGQLLINLHENIKCNEWVTVYFPLKDISLKDFESCELKFWVRSETSTNEQIFVDIVSLDLYTARNILPIVILIVILVLAFLSALICFVFVHVYKKNKQLLTK